MKALIAAVLLAPSALQAQTLPGGSELDDSKLAPATWQVTMTFRRGDMEMQAGTTKYELVALPGGRWGYITTTTTQLGTATDTSIARQKTLEPISHRSHAVPRTLSLDYAGTTVSGTYAPTDSAPRPIERVTAVPTFDAAMLDIILAALPLAAGYTTRLPMYIEEQHGLVWFDIAVAGETTVGAAAGWDVRVSMPNYSVSFVIARDDHRFLAGRVHYPNGGVMEMTRA